MKRILPGLYAGDDLRAERTHKGWAFEMTCNLLIPSRRWFEFSPHGSWAHIGTWHTLATGNDVAARLRRGNHFWDAEDQRCRTYSEEVYAELRAAS